MTGLRLRFDQIRDGQSEPFEMASEPIHASDNVYATASGTRNICFVLKDGNRCFLNYAYLVSGEYSHEGDLITLIFTSHTVSIKGSKLISTFELLQMHGVRILEVTDERYRETIDDSVPIISDITILISE